MDEKTEALLRELAEKLGTTGEHLWNVLTTQAMISGITGLFLYAAWIGTLVWAFFFLRRKTTGDYPSWEGAVVWPVWAIITVTTAMSMSVSLDGVLGQLINPEYWALQHVLKAIR